jgi:hypothetical protein
MNDLFLFLSFFLALSLISRSLKSSLVLKFRIDKLLREMIIIIIIYIHTAFSVGEIILAGFFLTIWGYIMNLESTSLRRKQLVRLNLMKGLFNC